MGHDVFNPSKINTKQPISLIIIFILSILITVATPTQDRAIYNASIIAIAKATDSAYVKHILLMY